MKRILLYISLFLTLFSTSCSKDALEFYPTTAIAGSSLLENTTAAMVPLSGIYRSMYKNGWTVTANYTHAFGISANNLAADVMGEDHVIRLKGGNWFYRDCTYDIKVQWNVTSARSYELWNQFYTFIANANYIIASKETMEGQPSDINYIIGAAYAIRAYSYFMLAQWYSRTKVGHENDPCVPIYTEPSVAGTKGKPRATVGEVYAVINADIDTALARLKNAPAQKKKVHIDYAVANGFKARMCMVQEDWEGARNAAKIARSTTEIGTGSDLTSGMNSVEYKNVIWGAAITPDQTHATHQFFAHMDADVTGSATRQPKLITKYLYNMMNSTDIRCKWWDPKAKYPYQQEKFKWADITTSMGDYIWMRNEEMLLTEAEAECRMGNDARARELLMELMKNRDTAYTCDKSGSALGALTTDLTGSLLEEILIQRRIELWGEFGRIYDIRRLKQGFKRTTAMGWPSAAIPAANTQNPETYAWVLPLPLKEFDGNNALDINKDQNPMDDGI